MPAVTCSETRPLWYDGVAMPAPPPLTSSISADVCIVGAGIAGLTVGYLLASEGTRVVIVDRGMIGGGETCRTTAHLSTALDHLYSELEGDIGSEGGRLAAESHRVAIDVIASIVRFERIACDFSRVDGYLFVPPGGSLDLLYREIEAARRAGLSDVNWAERAPLPSFVTGPCLRFGNQAQFHPLKYLAGLARAVALRGGFIFGNTPVCGVKGGSPCVVSTTTGYRINAASVVVATNSPIHDNLAVHLKQSPYRTYVIGAEIPRGAVPTALYWDTADPFHYVRLHRRARGLESLIVGGEDHRVGDGDDGEERFEALEEWTRARFPVKRVTHRWSGQVMESADGVGLIGHDLLDNSNVYFVTGDSGQGMTYGTIAGMLISDLVGGRSNAWRRLYDPTRMPLFSGDFYQENINVLWHYADWLTSGNVGTSDAIDRCDGAVIRNGLSKIAVYRDENGQTVEMSAVCPHFGCIVAWNSTERHWECPCHGSRFDRYGNNVNGPAAAPLSRINSRS
jgi:glycine/D-amino acid oxidase-like deaminating enzyme/nitrite reductase/ring-hydroxylating ferredoxin subunit